MVWAIALLVMSTAAQYGHQAGTAEREQSQQDGADAQGNYLWQKVCVCLEGAHVLLHYRVQIRDAQRPLEKLLPKRQSGLCVFMRHVGQ